MPVLVNGADFSSQIKQVDIVQRGDEYLLSATIDYQLSEKAKTALQNGVPLYWQLLIKLIYGIIELLIKIY